MPQSDLVEPAPSAAGLLDPETVQCPFPYFARLRRDAPIAWVPEEKLFLVTRYADAMSIIERPEVFSSKSGPGLRRKPTPEVLEVMAKGYPIPNTLITNDPPSHQRYRSLVNTVFTPRRVRALIPSMTEIANELVDAFVHDGHVELVSQFGIGLPLTVIADALGVPRDMLPTFRRWSDDSVAPNGANLPLERRLECAHSVVEFQHYFAGQLEERRRHPQNDLMTLLIDARSDDLEPLSTAEALGIIWVVLVAGNETTTNLISTAVRLLLENPDQLEAAKASPDLMDNAIEEALRLSSPAFANRRMAREDTEIGGVPIPKGSHILIMFGSANRDEELFGEPDRFDIHRPNVKSHIAFGHGIHFCLGAALARHEARIALDVLFGRLPNLRLAPENDFDYFPDIVIRGLKTLSLQFDPVPSS